MNIHKHQDFLVARALISGLWTPYIDRYVNPSKQTMQVLNLWWCVKLNPPKAAKPVADRIRDGISRSRSPNASSTWEKWQQDCNSNMCFIFYVWYLYRINAYKYIIWYMLCNTTICAHIYLKQTISRMKHHHPAHWCQPAKEVFVKHCNNLSVPKTQKVTRKIIEIHSDSNLWLCGGFFKNI